MAVKVAIDARGTGTGGPLALLHGLGASRLVWRRVAPRLARERLVLAPDLPGLGGSAPVGPGFDLADVAEALAGPLAERAGGSFDLLGTSLGGAVAVHLAVAHPDLVRRLVLAAPAGFTPWPWPLPVPLAAAAAGVISDRAIALRRVVGARAAGSATVRRALLWGTVAEPGCLSASDARTVFEASHGSERVGAALTAVLRADLRPLVRRLEVPLGLIWGERDRVVPVSTLESLRILCPDAPVETIPDAAHIPQLERPAEFVAAVRRVFERLA